MAALLRNAEYEPRAKGSAPIGHRDKPGFKQNERMEYIAATRGRYVQVMALTATS